MTETFWYKDWGVLYDPDRLMRFFPAKSMTLIERLNSSVRLAFYFAFLLFLFRGDYNVFFIPILALFLTYYIWKREGGLERDVIESKQTREEFNGSYRDNLLRPTFDNPFMNPNLIVHDPATFLPETKPGEEIRFDINHHIDTNDDVAIKGEIEDKFGARLYQSVGDVFTKENSQRQFYSVPVRTYPNDQSAFAQWCWGAEKSCKDGDGDACLTYDNNPRGSASVGAIKRPGPESVNLRKDWF